jgi:ribonuclease HI
MKKLYAVKKGRKPGIYRSWEECNAQVCRFSKGEYKSFKTYEEAVAFMEGKNFEVGPKPLVNFFEIEKSPIQNPCMCVDGSFMASQNVMEYRGILFPDNIEIFIKSSFGGSNNIAEYSAIVRGLKYCQKQGLSIPIYSDSKVAILWVKKKKANTRHAPQGSDLCSQLLDSENWLRDNTYTNPILFWDKKIYGEIPADFGRKRI